jgi:hypothetical protein
VAGASPDLRAGLAAAEPEESLGIPHDTRRETMITALYARKSTEQTGMGDEEGCAGWSMGRRPEARR